MGEQGDIDLARRGRIRGDGRAGGTEQGGQSRRIRSGDREGGGVHWSRRGAEQREGPGWLEQCELK